jgi:hypothetical protein
VTMVCGDLGQVGKGEHFCPCDHIKHLQKQECTRGRRFFA